MECSGKKTLTVVDDHIRRSRPMRYEAGVAQSVEQLICNQHVGGSIPLASSNGEVPERPKGADCKSAGEAFDGSNPSLTTKFKREIR